MPAPSYRATHCKHGHEFTPENTYVTSGGRQQCRACQRERNRKYHATEKYLDLNRGYLRERYHSPDPQVHRYISGQIQRRNLRRREKQAEQRLSQQAPSPLGDLVRSHIHQIGETAWRDIDRRTRSTSTGTASGER